MFLKKFFQMKSQFASGTTPDPGALRGYYSVKWVTGIFPPVRFFGHRKFFPEEVEAPEKGPGGFNEFLGKIRIGSFKISVQESILGDGQKVLLINYNRKGNPFWLRPLNDELKEIRKGYYLGRGVLKIFGFVFSSFYFSVEKE